MNEKTIRNLGVALVVILALYGLLYWRQSASFEPAKPKGFNFKYITKKTTNRIKVKNAEESYEIVKKSGKWMLEGLQVSSTALDELFNGLKDSEVQQIAATTKAKLSSLEIDGNKGRVVSFWTKKGKLTFVFGKSGTDGNSFYVREPKQNKAYSAKGNLGSVFSKKIDDWYDKEVTSLNQDNIEKVSFKYADSTFNISKNKKQWYLNEDGSKEKADTDKVETLLASITMINADKVVKPNEKIDFSDSEVITVYGKNKALVKLSLKVKEKKDYYIKSDKKKLTYILDEYTSKNIRKKAKDLK